MRLSTRWTAIIGLIGLVGVLLSCASAPPPIYYRLDYKVEAPPSGSKSLEHVLTIPPVKAPETLARSNILYRVSPRVLRHYQSRFWEQSPSQAAHQQVVRTFRAASIFKRISTRRLTLEADYSLTLNLTAFEEVMLGRERVAVVGMRYELATIKPKEIVLSKEAEAKVKVPGGEVARPEALAEAMSNALKACLDEIVVEVGKKVRE
jgi:ABC-type uncharacterized transport system auxiliary subunit